MPRASRPAVAAYNEMRYGRGRSDRKGDRSGAKPKDPDPSSIATGTAASAKAYKKSRISEVYCGCGSESGSSSKLGRTACSILLSRVWNKANQVYHQSRRRGIATHVSHWRIVLGSIDVRPRWQTSPNPLAGITKLSRASAKRYCGRFRAAFRRASTVRRWMEFGPAPRPIRLGGADARQPQFRAGKPSCGLSPQFALDLWRSPRLETSRVSAVEEPSNRLWSKSCIRASFASLPFASFRL